MSTIRPPMWFWVLASVLLLWNLLGAYVCVQQFRLGADAYPPATDYDRQLFASMPGWYDWNFAFAEVTGVGWAVALLARRSIAVPLFVLSLIGVVIQFGYVFTQTDVIAHKGLRTSYFPLFIAAVCLFQIAVARLARRRGWIG